LRENLTDFKKKERNRTSDGPNWGTVRFTFRSGPESLRSAREGLNREKIISTAKCTIEVPHRHRNTPVESQCACSACPWIESHRARQAHPSIFCKYSNGHRRQAHVLAVICWGGRSAHGSYSYDGEPCAIPVALPCGSTNLKLRSETTLEIYSSTCPVLGVSAIPGFCFTLGGGIAIAIEPPPPQVRKLPRA
jgi:hypothetical protein